MSYRNRLQPWCIVRHLPNAQNEIVERFRNRGEAEAYLQVLKRLLPAAYHSVMFNPDDNSQEQAAIPTDISYVLINTQKYIGH